MVKNLCEFCVHRKMCFCGEQNIPTEECMYYDPCVVRCRDCIGKSTWVKDAAYGFDVCCMSGMYPKSENDFCSFGERKEDFERAIKHMPDSIIKDVALVKHGHWILGTGESALQKGYRMCSQCGEIVKYAYTLYGEHNFCNYCGADMRGGKDEQ